MSNSFVQMQSSGKLLRLPWLCVLQYPFWSRTTGWSRFAF